METVENIYNRDQPVGLLLGLTGSGKTTFFDKLCECEGKHSAGISVDSLTRDIYLNKVMVDQQRFILIDTPGTNPSTRVLEHMIAIKESLTMYPLNVIFVMVQFNSRYSNMIQEFQEIKQILKDESFPHIVPIISKMDNAQREIAYNMTHQQPENVAGYAEEQFLMVQQDIQAKFRSEMKVQDIIFSGQIDDKYIMRRNILEILKKYSKVKLEYDRYDFIRLFNQSSIPILREQCKQLTKAAKSMNIFMLEELDRVQESITDKYEKEEIVSNALMENREGLNSILDYFQEENGSNMMSIDDYSTYIQLQKEIHFLQLDFKQNVMKYLSYNPDDPNDLRNLFRKCPHCLQFWVKVEGCDGGTTCGNRPTQLVDKIQSRAKKYYDFLTNPLQLAFQGRIRRKQKPAQQSVTPREPQKNQTTSTPQKGVGCGQKIVWSEMPRLTDDELKQLFDTTDIEEFLKNFIQKPDYQRKWERFQQSVTTRWAT